MKYVLKTNMTVLLKVIPVASKTTAFLQTRRRWDGQREEHRETQREVKPKCHRFLQMKIQQNVNHQQEHSSKMTPFFRRHDPWSNVQYVHFYTKRKGDSKTPAILHHAAPQI